MFRWRAHGSVSEQSESWIEKRSSDSQNSQNQAIAKRSRVGRIALRMTCNEANPDRMSDRLENRYGRFTSIEGSNPSPSAKQR
jgi:hypothetical protein